MKRRISKHDGKRGAFRAPEKYGKDMTPPTGGFGGSGARRFRWGREFGRESPRRGNFFGDAAFLRNDEGRQCWNSLGWRGAGGQGKVAARGLAKGVRWGGRGFRWRSVPSGLQRGRRRKYALLKSAWAFWIIHILKVGLANVSARALRAKFGETGGLRAFAHNAISGASGRNTFGEEFAPLDFLGGSQGDNFF